MWSSSSRHLAAMTDTLCIISHEQGKERIGTLSVLTKRSFALQQLTSLDRDRGGPMGMPHPLPPQRLCHVRIRAKCWGPPRHAVVSHVPTLADPDRFVGRELSASWFGTSALAIPACTFWISVPLPSHSLPLHHLPSPSHPHPLLQYSRSCHISLERAMTTSGSHSFLQPSALT